MILSEDFRSLTSHERNALFRQLHSIIMRFKANDIHHKRVRVSRLINTNIHIDHVRSIFIKQVVFDESSSSE